MTAGNVAEALLPRDQGMVWLNSTPVAADHSSTTGTKPHKIHVPAVERHRVGWRVAVRLSHQKKSPSAVDSATPRSSSLQSWACCIRRQGSLPSGDVVPEPQPGCAELEGVT
jgi:hypothetical protein